MDLNLIITSKNLGNIDTNIAELEQYVANRLQDYAADKYVSDADSAKKDRAELNAASKKISRMRIDLMRELTKPFNDFEIRCKALEKNIEAASHALDEIVKEKEAKEKTKKEASIEKIWSKKNINFIELKKIFRTEWLNKSYKMKDIEEEIDKRIKSIETNLKIIEKTGYDIELLKANYLSCLDLETAIKHVEELKRQQAAAEKEKAAREEREKERALALQQKEILAEKIAAEKDAAYDELAADALCDSQDDIVQYAPKTIDYVISFSTNDKRMAIAAREAVAKLGLVCDLQELKLDF